MSKDLRLKYTVLTVHSSASFTSWTYRLLPLIDLIGMVCLMVLTSQTICTKFYGSQI